LLNIQRTTVRSAFAQAVAGAPVLPTLIVAYALALIIYLPVEPALIGGLPTAAYWALRLLPDGLVALLALGVVLVGDRTARTAPVRILWVVAAVCLILVVANAARGFSVIDSINALRLEVRYLVLGLLVWWALIGRASAGPLIVSAVLLAGLVQVVIALGEIVARALPSLGTGALDPSVLFFIDGSLGRYDRLGLLLMSVVLATVATGERIGRPRSALLVACMVLLYFTTSRQAMIGVAVACGLLLIYPGTAPRRRLLAFGLAAVSVLFVVAVPLRTPPPQAEDPDTTIGLQAPGPTSPPNPTGPKTEVQLSVDPNLNFRLFYNLTLAPWAASTEPFLGFGPLQQVAEQPDPRILSRIEVAGMPWSYARMFMNDSNFASLIVQFGVIAPGLFLLLLVSVAVLVARSATRPSGGFARFALVNTVAVMVAAWFGPTFEIRMISVILWVALMGAIAIRPVMAPRADRDPTVAA
jgi:hypothetical protein